MLLLTSPVVQILNGSLMIWMIGCATLGGMANFPPSTIWEDLNNIFLDEIAEDGGLLHRKVEQHIVSII